MSYGKDVDLILDQYAMCSRYFGNRIHGAIISRSIGAESWCVGTDSRLEAAKLAGVRVNTPEQLDLDQLNEWAKKDGPADARPSYKEAWSTQRAMFDAMVHPKPKAAGA